MGETTQEVGRDSIFTFDERRGIVRSFVSAYLRGSVRTDIWTSEEAREVATNKPMPPELKAMTKNYFLHLVKTVCGTKQVSTDELKASIDEMFSLIVTLRSGDFIQGEFLQSPDLETRISAIHERVATVEKLLEELQLILKLRGSQP